MRRTHKSALGAVIVGAGAVVALNAPIIAQSRPNHDADARGSRANENHQRRNDRGEQRGEQRGERDRFDGRGDGERGPQRGRGGQRGPSVEQLDEVADLTPEQEKKVAAVLDDMHEQMQRLHEETRRKIDGILTAEQREKLQQMHERRGEPGGPRGGEPGGPRREGRFGPPPRDGFGSPRDGFGPPRDGFGPPPRDEFRGAPPANNK